MFIEKFTVFIKDIASKRTKKIKVDADDACSAHKKALSYYNELTQDVIKIVDSEGTLAYNIDSGFVI